jgi:hypothetical protein
MKANSGIKTIKEKPYPPPPAFALKKIDTEKGEEHVLQITNLILVSRRRMTEHEL